MGIGNLLSYYIPNKATEKAETIFQRTQLSIILNWNEEFLSCASTLCKKKKNHAFPRRFITIWKSWGRGNSQSRTDEDVPKYEGL